jgi:hypothetical protein
MSSYECMGVELIVVLGIVVLLGVAFFILVPALAVVCDWLLRRRR